MDVLVIHGSITPRNEGSITFSLEVAPPLNYISLLRALHAIIGVVLVVSYLHASDFPYIRKFHPAAVELDTVFVLVACVHIWAVLSRQRSWRLVGYVTSSIFCLSLFTIVFWGYAALWLAIWGMMGILILCHRKEP